MATSRNEFTGAKLQTRPATQAYYSGWDAIFAKKEAEPVEVTDEDVVDPETVVEADK